MNRIRAARRASAVAAAFLVGVGGIVATTSDARAADPNVAVEAKGPQ